MEKRFFSSWCAVLVGLALSWTLSAQMPQFPPRVKPYLDVKDIPNAVVFLPPPPEEGTPQFEYDESQYRWGKTQRAGERGLRAIREETTNVDSMAALFSGAFGMKLSKETTPKTMLLLDRSVRTFRLGATGPKAAYMRLRPYVFYNEGTLIPDSEEGYMLILRAKAAAHDGRGVADVIGTVEKKGIYLSPAAREEISFWSA